MRAVGVRGTVAFAEAHLAALLHFRPIALRIKLHCAFLRLHNLRWAPGQSSLHLNTLTADNALESILPSVVRLQTLTAQTGSFLLGRKFHCSGGQSFSARELHGSASPSRRKIRPQRFGLDAPDDSGWPHRRIKLHISGGRKYFWLVTAGGKFNFQTAGLQIVFRRRAAC